MIRFGLQKLAFNFLKGKDVQTYIVHVRQLFVAAGTVA